MNTVRLGFFGFKRVKSYVLCIGVANIDVKKNQGLAFHRTGDRPEALLCPIVMKSVTNKHPRMWDFFSRTALPKFSVEFNKKKSKTKRKTVAEN